MVAQLNPYDMDIQPFLGKVPHPLLWPGSWAACGRTTVNGEPNSMNQCVIFIAHTHFTNVTADRIMQPGRRRLKTRVLGGPHPVVTTTVSPWGAFIRNWRRFYFTFALTYKSAAFLRFSKTLFLHSTYSLSQEKRSIQTLCVFPIHYVNLKCLTAFIIIL